jgi:hypothetical protein
MKVKQTQQQQHKDQTTHDKIHGVVDGLTQFNAVGNQMKTGDTQYQSSHKAHHELSLHMRQGIAPWQPPSNPRGDK